MSEKSLILFLNPSCVTVSLLLILPYPPLTVIPSLPQLDQDEDADVFVQVEAADGPRGRRFPGSGPPFRPAAARAALLGRRRFQLRLEHTVGARRCES